MKHINLMLVINTHMSTAIAGTHGVRLEVMAPTSLVIEAAPMSLTCESRSFLERCSSNAGLTAL